MPRRNVNQSSNLSIVNRLKELERRFQQRMDMPSAAEVDLLSEIGGLQEKIQSLSSTPNSIAQTAQDIYAAQENVERLYSRLDPIETRRQNVATKGYISGVTTALRTSHLLTEVNSIAGEAGTIGRALPLTKSATGRLEEQRQAALASLTATAGNIIERAANDPNVAIAPEMMAKLGSNLSTAAETQAALTTQRRMRQDVESRMVNSRESTSRISNYLESRDLRTGVAEGTRGDRVSVEANLREDLDRAKRFQMAQERFAGDPDKIERFQRAIDRLTDSANKAANTLKEMDRQGVGGGGGGFVGDIASFLNTPKVHGNLQVAQSMFNLGTDALDTWTYQNPIREKQNMISYGNIANRQFDDMRAASRGDASALRRLGGGWGGYQQAADVNAATKQGSWGSSAFELAGTVAGAGLAVGGAVATATGVGASVGVPMMLGGMTLIGAANRSAGNVRQQAGERGVQMSEATLKAGDVAYHINDAVVQEYIDYTKGMGQATVGLGTAGRGGVFNQLTGPFATQRFSQVGIDTERLTQLTGMGNQLMGGEFDPSQIYRAGQLRMGGHMGEEQYFRSVGQLSMVGGNADKNLEAILKSAVANGMDSAKSIAQMVQATTSLASRSATTGIDTVSGATAMIGRMTTAAEEAGTPTNMRGAMIQTAADTIERLSGDRSLNLRTVGRWGRTARNFPGANRAQLERLSELTVTEIDTLSGPDGKRAAIGWGQRETLLDSKGNIDTEKVKKLRENAMLEIAQGIVQPGYNEGAITALQKGNKTLIDRYRTNPETLTEAERQAASTILSKTSGAGLAVDEVMSGMMPGVGKKADIPTTTAGGAGQIDEQLKSAAAMQAKMVESGRITVGSLDNLTKALNSISTKIDPKSQAEDTKKGMNAFDLHVVELGAAVKDLANAIQGMKYGI